MRIGERTAVDDYIQKRITMILSFLVTVIGVKGKDSTFILIQFNFLLDKAHSLQCVIPKINKRKLYERKEKIPLKLHIKLRFIRHWFKHIHFNSVCTTCVIEQYKVKRIGTEAKCLYSSYPFGLRYCKYAITYNIPGWLGWAMVLVLDYIFLYFSSIFPF